MIGADDGRGPILSLDIGGTKVGFGRVALASDGTWNIDGRGSIPTNADDGGAAVAQRIAQLVTEQLDAGAEGGAVKGIAVASAGVVDPRSGNIVSNGASRMDANCKTSQRAEMNWHEPSSQNRDTRWVRRLVRSQTAWIPPSSSSLVP